MSNTEKRKSSSAIGFPQPRDYRLSAGNRKSRKVDSPVHRSTMDRSSMLLMEANEISQYLHLDYVCIFSYLKWFLALSVTCLLCIVL